MKSARRLNGLRFMAKKRNSSPNECIISHVEFLDSLILEDGVGRREDWDQRQGDKSWGRRFIPVHSPKNEQDLSMKKDICLVFFYLLLVMSCIRHTRRRSTGLEGQSRPSFSSGLVFFSIFSLQMIHDRFTLNVIGNKCKVSQRRMNTIRRGGREDEEEECCSSESLPIPSASSNHPVILFSLFLCRISFMK